MDPREKEARRRDPGGRLPGRRRLTRVLVRPTGAVATPQRRSAYQEGSNGHRGSVALVTGANRGIGRALTRALLGCGAAKVYVGVRDPASVADADVTPLRLDVTKPGEIAAAATAAGDVTMVINNAGAGGTGTKLLDGPLDGAREAMEVNYFGT